MFICQFCGMPTGPKISPISVVVTIRDRAYTSTVQRCDEERSYTDTVHSSGSEISAEAKQCPTCAGVPPRENLTIDPSGFKLIATGSYGHLRGCTGKRIHKDRFGNKIEEPCRTCERIIADFREIPLPILSLVLEDVMPRAAMFSMAELCVESLMSRTMDTGKRAKRDFEAGYPVLKTYEKRGGGL